MDQIVTDIQRLQSMLTGACTEGELPEISGLLSQIEHDHIQLRDVLTGSASAKLSITMVLHEVEKASARMVQLARDGADHNALEEQSELLDRLINSLWFVTSRAGYTDEKASKLAEIAFSGLDYRIQNRVHIQNHFTAEKDFLATCNRRLIVGVLFNLIDNALFWMDQQSSDIQTIMVGPVHTAEGRDALVLADTGPGLSIEPQLALQPFVSTKPNGMGMGLYLANEVMRKHGGEVVFLDAEQHSEANVPDGFEGCTVCLVF